MTSQEQALVRLARQLSDLEVGYMVIGGLANAVWGEPRATLDIDVTVAAQTADCDRLIEGLASHFTPLVADPSGFVEATHVLPLESRTGIRVDLIFGLLPFERDAIARATGVMVQGVEVSFCTAEDLILLKIISTRERDRSDVQGIVRRLLPQLDLGYLEPRIEEMAQLLERPEILEDWGRWKSGN